MVRIASGNYYSKYTYLALLESPMPSSPLLSCSSVWMHWITFIKISFLRSHNVVFFSLFYSQKRNFLSFCVCECIASKNLQRGAALKKESTTVDLVVLLVYLFLSYYPHGWALAKWAYSIKVLAKICQPEWSSLVNQLHGITAHSSHFFPKVGGWENKKSWEENTQQVATRCSDQLLCIY